MDTSSGHGDASPGSAATEAAGYSTLGQRATANETASPGSADFAAADGPRAASTATGPLAAERLMEDLQSLRSALELLVAARYDQIKLTLRRALLWGLLAAVAVFAIGALAVSGCVLLVVGIAGGVAQLAGGRLWVGQLSTGAALMIGGAATIWLLVRAWQEQSRRKVLKRYGKNDL